MAINGTVKFFNHSRGFGFIAPEDGSKDIFVHASALEASGIPAIDEGDKVTFEVADDPQGDGLREGERTAHREDPLAHLELTTRPMYDAALLSRELADEVCSGRWVATGGGGYQPYRVIPRAWSLVWAAMTGQTVPDRIDQAWREHWRAEAGTELPEYFFDEDPGGSPLATEQNVYTLSRLQEAL